MFSVQYLLFARRTVITGDFRQISSGYNLVVLTATLAPHDFMLLPHVYHMWVNELSYTYP